MEDFCPFSSQFRNTATRTHSEIKQNRSRTKQEFSREAFSKQIIGHCRNVRGLGKSMVVFRLFEKVRCSNERSTKFENLYHK